MVLLTIGGSGQDRARVLTQPAALALRASLRRLREHPRQAPPDSTNECAKNLDAGQDRVWRTRTQLELAIVEWVAWFNTDRLHESLGDLPPAEFETLSSGQYV